MDHILRLYKALGEQSGIQLPHWTRISFAVFVSVMIVMIVLFFVTLTYIRACRAEHQANIA